MIRGTTPTLEFTLPFEVESLSTLYVTFKQLGRTVIERELKDCRYDGKVLYVDLTQNDTLSFTAGQQVDMQIRAKFTSGKAVASEIMTTSVQRVLKGGVV